LIVLHLLWPDMERLLRCVWRETGVQYCLAFPEKERAL
jgi:hypothetical protein